MKRLVTLFLGCAAMAVTAPATAQDGTVYEQSLEMDAARAELMEQAELYGFDPTAKEPPDCENLVGAELSHCVSESVFFTKVWAYGASRKLLDAHSRREEALLEAQKAAMEYRAASEMLDDAIKHGQAINDAYHGLYEDIPVEVLDAYWAMREASGEQLEGQAGNAASPRPETDQ